MTSNGSQHGQSAAKEIGATCPVVPSLDLLLPMEAAQTLRMKTSRIYALIRAGRLPVIKVGRRYLIVRVDLEAFVLSLRVEGLE
jgi:excisionase family DNA binding protein